MTERVIMNPETLLEVSEQFKRRADMHLQNLSVIMGQLNTLRTQGPEGWIGDAANQHFAKMEQYIIPGYKRLIEALHQAAATVKYTQNEFQTSDHEGGKAFKQLDSTGNGDADAAIKRGGGEPLTAIDKGAAGQGNGNDLSSNGGSQQGGGNGGGQSSGGTGDSGSGAGSGGGQQGAGSGGGQQGAGSGGGQQGAGSRGSLGNSGGSKSAPTSGVRSGGAVGHANDNGSNWIAGLAAVGGTVIAGAKLANDVRKK
jgi:uncharacterized protein YukE